MPPEHASNAFHSRLVSQHSRFYGMRFPIFKQSIELLLDNIGRQIVRTEYSGGVLNRYRGSHRFSGNSVGSKSFQVSLQPSASTRIKPSDSKGSFDSFHKTLVV
jgi:hypothetical protein